MTDFWKNKNVFLTGASSGIGEALAEAIAARGGNLALIARRSDVLEKLAQKCSAMGIKAKVFAVDVRDADALIEAADNFRKEVGPVDILIANAGIGGNDRETRDLDPQAVKKVIDINLIGAVNAVSAVLPQMLEKKSGQIIAVSSLAGTRGLPGSAAYSASKAGMNNFFESVRLDLSGRNIAVTIIKPGFIKTPLTSGRANKMPFLMELNDAIPKFLRAVESRKKVASFPWQLAAVVRFAGFLPSGIYDMIAGRARYRE